MRKLVNPLFDDRPRRRWRYSNLLPVALGLLLTPILYEASLLCVAEWRAMSGPIAPIHTPVFDAIRSAFLWARQDVGSFLSPAFHALPWRPAVVIPFAVFWTGVAAWLLRKA